jgi:hypothetical protein
LNNKGKNTQQQQQNNNNRICQKTRKKGGKMMSFEEILQTRSIEELRTLVGELEVEGKSKQSELQQMVASQYNLLNCFYCGYPVNNVFSRISIPLIFSTVLAISENSNRYRQNRKTADGRKIVEKLSTINCKFGYENCTIPKVNGFGDAAASGYFYTGTI